MKDNNEPEPNAVRVGEKEVKEEKPRYEEIPKKKRTKQELEVTIGPTQGAGPDIQLTPP